MRKLSKALNATGFGKHIGDNIRHLEEGFHATHPAYTEFVARRLDNILEKNGKLTTNDITTVISEMHPLIDSAENAFKATGSTLNNFFKNF